MIRRLVLSCACLALGATAMPAQTDLVIVSGLGGQPKYVREFAGISVTLAEAANTKAGLPDSAIAWLGESGVPASKWLRGPSTRANVVSTLERIAAHGGDQLVIVLVGHGAGEGPETRISLPGPDLTAADFANLLTRVGGRRVAFVNLTSGSGDMLRLLAARDRVVITATKSAFERNESQFARYFADAFAKDVADVDKDGRVSLLEAFRYADAEVRRFYEDAGRLATEHAQLADSGQLAARFFLTADEGTSTRVSNDPRINALYAKRATLDKALADLKSRKAGMQPEAYERELERLLVEIAATSEEIRKMEKGS